MCSFKSYRGMTCTCSVLYGSNRRYALDALIRHPFFFLFAAFDRIHRLLARAHRTHATLLQRMKHGSISIALICISAFTGHNVSPSLFSRSSGLLYVVHFRVDALNKGGVWIQRQLLQPLVNLSLDLLVTHVARNHFSTLCE